MSQLFQRKPIASLLHEAEQGPSLQRVMGAGDLVMLAIGAVIGAGIFSSIGTAAAGETLPSGEVVRYGAGPALILSFLLLGLVCGLAALCYAELAAMIPQAGSAYAYSYATLGELVAWIIGWDLILEYAVGNIAVAIAWSGYFTSLLTAFGIHLPDFLTHGYRTALLSSNPEIHGLLQTAPRLAGIPILLNIPAFVIVMLITWLLYIGVKESVRANNVMVVVKLLVLGLFVVLGATHINPDNYVPFAPNGWRGIHQGAAIVFFAYIGFDAISTAAEETRDPQRNMPIGILGGLAICTVIYVIVGIVATGLVPYQQLRAADPLAQALRARRAPDGERDRGVRRGRVADRRPARFPVRPAADFLRDGARRPPAGSGLASAPALSDAARDDGRHGLVVAVGALFMDENEIYDLTNIGTLSAFAIVCIGVLVLRTTDPDRPRPFRVPALPAGVSRRRGRLRLRHARPAAARVGALRHLARARAGDLLCLRVLAQPAANRRPAIDYCDQRRGVTMENTKSRVTIHMAASLDGFIARKNGSVDWLETSDHFEGGDTMAPEFVEEFLKTIDCYVMGSRTYETALDFEAKGLGWAYGDKPTFVLTSRALRKTRETVEFYSGDLAHPGEREIEAELPQHLVRWRWCKYPVSAFASDWPTKFAIRSCPS